MKRVSVLMGGYSKEREVSLASGANCAAALKEAGAPQEALDGLWAAYTGSGSPAPADDDLV